MLCRNIPVPFQYVISTSDELVHLIYYYITLGTMWPLVIIALLLTFSFGQSAEIGVDQSQLKMLQRRGGETESNQ